MRRNLLALPVALTLLGLVAHTTRARAQIDPFRQSYGVYQRDQLVGEIFREDTDPVRYTEHWVLYPTYVYPSATNGAQVVIRPSGRVYENVADFEARVPWTRGTRYVETVCNESMTLPIRR